MAGRRIEFHVAAQSEVEEGITYYEACESGLGEQFFAELRRALSLLSDYPEIGAEIWNTRRRLLLDRFPYGLIYRVPDDGSIRVPADPVCMVFQATDDDMEEYWRAQGQQNGCDGRWCYKRKPSNAPELS